jgi:hypothetical protein
MVKEQLIAESADSVKDVSSHNKGTLPQGEGVARAGGIALA